MKRKRNKYYSAEHVIQRLLERYGLQIDEKEYPKLCALVAREVALGRGIQEPNSEDPQIVVVVTFKSVRVTAVWSVKDQRVRTVLPR